MVEPTTSLPTSPREGLAGSETGCDRGTELHTDKDRNRVTGRESQTRGEGGKKKAGREDRKRQSEERGRRQERDGEQTQTDVWAWP